MADHDYKSIRSKLTAILATLSAVLTEDDLALLRDFLEANELGLALESIIDAVREGGGRIPRSTRDELMTLAIKMQLDAAVRDRLDAITGEQ